MSFDPFAEQGSGIESTDGARPQMLTLWLDDDNAEAVPYSEITRISRHKDRLLTLHCPSFMIEIEGRELVSLWDDLLAYRAVVVKQTDEPPVIKAIKLIPLSGNAVASAA